MPGTLLIAGVLLTASCAPVGSAPLPVPTEAPAAVRKVTVQVAMKGAPYAHHLIAIEKGYYAQQGLDVELVTSSGTNGVAATLAGEVDFTTSASTALSAILKGAPMKVIFTHADRPAYQLWSTSPDVRTLADLPGKAVGVNSRGDAMEQSTRMVLVAAGIDPSTVAYMPLNTGAARLAALQSGGVGASILGIADVQKLHLSGTKGTLLADMSKEVSMLFNGLATTDRLLRDEPAVVSAFLRGTLMGREYFRRHKEPTLEIIARYNGTPREVNVVDYESMLATLTRDGTLASEMQRADARMRADLIGAQAVRPMEEMFDYGPLQAAATELQRAGFSPEP